MLVRPDAPPSELAVAVARHFEGMDIDEESVLGGFLGRLDGGNEYADSSKFYIGLKESSAAKKRRRTKDAAAPGEQVAAKTSRNDENGSWILATVQQYYRDTETYDVQDDDDVTKLIRLPFNHVMRLSTGKESFTKGTTVMAIFPETTSFYKAVVSKAPVWVNDRKHGPIVNELILKFMDDEDDSGKTPHRRVPSRYVIPLPEHYFEGDE